MGHKEGCPAVEHFNTDGKEIFSNSQFIVKICDIETISKEGEVEHHGWGLRMINHRHGKDKAYCFKYCPWCGAEVSG